MHPVGLISALKMVLVCSVGFFLFVSLGVFTAQSSFYYMHLKDNSTILAHFIKVFFMAVVCSNPEATNGDRN